MRQSDRTTNARDTTNIQLTKPVLKRGDKGSAVVELQKLLFHWGNYTSLADGLFDCKVEVAVKAFQHRVFLEDNGIVCSLTWQALYKGAPVNMPVLQLGSQGEVVIVLQTVLQGMRYYNEAIHGKFDAPTDTAARSFQRRYGLVPDGIIGPHTWSALSKVPH